jgi:hypothetical protein
MARQKKWKGVTSFSMSNFDYDSLDDVIEKFKKLSEQYPGARVKERFEDYSENMVIELQVLTDETDAEMNKREADEAKQAERLLAQKRAQYAELKKEFGNE